MSLSVQFYTMLAMFGMGSWVGAALDTYGRFLQRPKRARWLLFINDLSFWIVQGLIIFYVLLLVNEGELRFYVFLALLCGYAAYQSIFKSFYMNFLEHLIRFVIRTYQFIAKLITTLVIKPIRYLIHLLVVLLITLWGVLLVILKFLLNVVYLPLKWISLVVWKLLPKKVKMFFNDVAGFLIKIKNFKNIGHKWLAFIKKWWQNFRS
ncbi:spore cortex biosynthesis protein YabQ [Bacillus suaedaesalsae]|uniref:Spore cortex biosynthesis protein YabQ n=1 Tax=Bacillus suaedaesalsae TaxID=2810349 RepID=A0ABS2DDH7_9BACI|nr:spore cortex biosynthesis protein YabQ [Bacillus suaedaesalsae]MBM6616095.1 spore cortex biosynthesis protein YabQ [Bacillus suaedaesalsae]